ncbi:MAG TPA: hypothetical protein VGN38_09045 [Caulobacteraceae bacterium]|nr:hypothetical protein [Caulobacteraceae bacterium]
MSPARQAHLAAAMLAASVLADSGVEHYRGSFYNRAMFAPLAAAAATLAAGVAGAMGSRSRFPRDRVYALAAIAGVIGLGFHAWNILKRPGRLSWENLFYGAPVAAPAALVLAGTIGAAADAAEKGKRSWRGLPLGRLLAAVSALGLAGSAGEAGLLHFRGAFQNPAMVLPVSGPPVAAALIAGAAAKPSKGLRRIADLWLKLTAALGLAGVGFHAFGVGRSMGGWRNWRQNLLNGPPLPAPPSFTGLAIAGLAALALLEDGADG